MKPAAEWNLSPTETDVMDALVSVEDGHVETVAARLGVTRAAVTGHCYRIRKKVGAEHGRMLPVALAWDRYSRKAAL